MSAAPRTISPGKLWGLRRLADEGGRFKMLAIDQTGPIVNPIKEKRGLAHAPYDDVVAVKRMLAQHLAGSASAVLVDPPYGYAAVIDEIPPRKGLIVASEWAVWETTPTGRKSANVPGWDAGTIRRLGADAVKVNLWMRPDMSAQVRAHQLAYLADAKAACAAQDVPFVLEFLTYPFPDEDAESFAQKRPGLVRAALADPAFLDPEGVELYKLEAPVAVTAVPDPDGPQAAAVQAAFDGMAAGIGRPWVLLSGGASTADFLRLLCYAFRAGASGFLAGRAIWADAFAAFPDLPAMAARLRSSDALARLNELTERMATPWHRHPAWSGGVVMSPAGREFAALYVGVDAAAPRLA